MIWKKSMDLTDIVFRYCKGLPANERFNLIDQMNRCSCSIHSNIAEGSGKKSKLQFAEFLSTSLSSSYELETQLLICERRTFGSSELLNDALDMIVEVQKMIFTFRDKILST